MHSVNQYVTSTAHLDGVWGPGPEYILVPLFDASFLLRIDNC